MAQERGDFDDLPGAGKPLRGLGTEHDPRLVAEEARRARAHQRAAARPRAPQGGCRARRTSRRDPGGARGAPRGRGLQCAGAQGALHRRRRATPHHHAA
ncbi:DnaJ family domain-containing protein [Nocardioides sp. B-3]|uniref:DnaJ family domain-containing protein n=1 Tax=Nocardioides sp. B-3 TaxID=2895565 RepID=UPI003FA5F39C